MSSNVKRLLRALIAMVVVVGLVLAGRSALTQWKHQKDAAIAQITDIERAISKASTADQLRKLERELAAARSEVPEMANLSWAKISLAALLYAIGLIPGGLVLWEGARVLGYRVPIQVAVSAQVLGHLGKYVPGKAMVVVIRAGRLTAVGVPVLAGSIAVFLETLSMMAVGAAIAGCLIFLLPVARWIAWSALAGGILATLPTLPPILRWVVRKVGINKPEMNLAPVRQDQGPDTESNSASDSALIAISHNWRFFLSAWIWQLIAWGLIGASFACLVESVPGVGTEYSTTVLYAASVASIALAMVAGFASLLPGGAGVRELTLAVVLAPVIGGSQALLAAILARLLFIAVELLAVLAVTLVGRLREIDPMLE